MIILKYRNAQLQTGLTDWRIIYQLPRQQLMFAEIHQGKLHYCLKGSSRRISYARLKKGLVKKQITIFENLLF